MPYNVPDAVREPLYVVVPYHNPWRSKAREKHTTRAIKHFIDSGAVVYLIEAGFNRRELAFADSGLEGTLANCNVIGSDHNFRHRYIGLHSKSELWLKENLINRAVVDITADHFDWQQVAWLDGDIHFARPNWVGEAIHKLQHGTESDIAFLQMFSEARDLAPNYEMLPEDYPHASGLGFVQAWRKGKILNDAERAEKIVKKIGRETAGDVPKVKLDVAQVESALAILVADIEQYPYPDRVFPGLAWACTRKAWDAVGGLLDVAIWGGGDWHMSHALIEKTEGMMRNDLHHNYKKLVNQWYQRCRTQVRKNVLVMEGIVFHHWHGKKTARGYNVKHAILANKGFDPPRHLKKDSQGLWQLHDDRSPAFTGIRDLMRVVARERNEDSIDI